MEIPRYWAEHREHRTLSGRREVTLARFGWSAASQEEAQRRAEQRVAEAWAGWQAGRTMTRRERKVAYAGMDDLPIREEIISEHPDSGAVVTRNAYGARCLNVADILFADIDADDADARLGELRSTVILSLFLIGFLAAFLTGADGSLRTVPALLLGAAILLACRKSALAIGRWRRALHPESALQPVRRWCAAHADWRVHAYRTPAGLRLLATHAAIDPRGDEAAAFFAIIPGDPKYQLMCRKQACFRARVSPKPWRIGIAARMGRGAWPVATAAAVARRTAWVDAYEAKSRDFAACAYMESIGDAPEHPRGRALRELHDRLCQSDRRLPLA